MSEIKVAKPPRPSIWKNGNYTWWLAGDTTGAIGRSFSMFIVSFAAYDLSGSEAISGSITTIMTVVMLVFAVPGGVITDRTDRRRLIYLYSTFAAIICLTLSGLIVAGQLSIGVFIGFMCLLGMVAGFFGEATNASLRSIVQGSDYVHAQAANQGRDAAVQLAARPLAGLFYGIAAWLPYLLSGIMYAVQGLVFTRVKTSLEPRPTKEPEADPQTELATLQGEQMDMAGASIAPVRQSMRKDFLEGFNYLMQRPTTRSLSIIVMIINLGTAGIGSAMTLSLIGRGYAAVEVGYVGVAVGAAVIVSSLVAGKLSAKSHTGLITVLGLGWVVLVNIPLLFTDAYWVMIVCSFALGLCLPIINAALIGFIFGQAPEELQGRVGTVVNLAASGLAALAPITAGFVLEWTEFEVACAVFLAICTAAFILALLSKRVRNIPVPEEWCQYE